MTFNFEDNIELPHYKILKRNKGKWE